MCDCGRRYKSAPVEHSDNRPVINGYDKHLLRHYKGRSVSTGAAPSPALLRESPAAYAGRGAARCRRRSSCAEKELSEFPGEVSNVAGSGADMANGEMTSMMESFPPRKTSVLNRLNSTGSGSSINSAGSSAASSVVTSSRVKRSQQQVMHHSMSTSEMTSSSNASKHAMSTQEIKSNLSELKSSMSEMKSSLTSHLVSAASSSTTNSSSTVNRLTPGFLRGSLERLNKPGDSTDLSLASEVGELSLGGNAKELKFEQTRVASASSTKITTGDGFSSEEATANASHSRRLQADGIHYEESAQAAAMKARVEVDGVSAEKAAAIKQEQRTLKAGDISQQEMSSSAAASMKLTTDSFSAEKMAMASQQQRQTITSAGIFNQERHAAASSQSKLTINTTSIKKESSSMVSSSQVNGMISFDMGDSLSLPPLDDLDHLSSASHPADVEKAIVKYSGLMSSCVERMKHMDQRAMPVFLEKVNEMVKKAYAVPTHGYKLGNSLCDALRHKGGLDILMNNCAAEDETLQLSSARLLEQCLTQENREYVVEKGLETVVKLACGCTEQTATVDQSRVGTGLLEHLFQHDQGTCSSLVKLGGLHAVVRECKRQDVEILRHCAGALANLSLYGGAENQEVMIKCNVPMWLFPLAFHADDNIKYYACLAIAVLVANKEIEATVLQSVTLSSVEPLVAKHNPFEFANTVAAHKRGHSRQWLELLVPVLNSKREEARNLAAFHFCMEAVIKKSQGLIHIFRDIGAIEPLKMVASSPNATASKYAAQALRLIGEQVPHKLSQQVPLWSTEDVKEWVKQIGFLDECESFVQSKVDGDLLLQLTEEMLYEDIGVKNAILRKRFMRELAQLKKMSDYSSVDKSELNEFLHSVDPSFCCYTYNMLMAGVDKSNLRYLTEDQLRLECGIENSIHRQRIFDSIRMESGLCEPNDNKPLDVFISYRRATGSQLASLLKVHLQLRNFSVFIDVERLEAGKFDNNLQKSIRQAKHFLLVLTPNSLDRCRGDDEGKDWVHREIVEALRSNCKIIPILDNFQWPVPEELPEDMRPLCYFNGIRWVHDYQDACVDKLEKFMRGEVLRGRGDATPIGGPSLNSIVPNPAVVRQPAYQRTQSNESSKGSYTSDKENSLSSVSNGGLRGGGGNI